MGELKDVYKSENGVETVEQKECHPRKLSLTSKYIAPYWFQAIHNVFKYDKERGLQETHKLVDDSRLIRGYKLYKEGHIASWVVTKHRGGDVRAIVTSEDGEDEYTVIIKDYLPPKLPQFNHEREQFIANLFIDCTCTDHQMAHYKDNSSMMCKHINCILFFLINDKRFFMPRIFLTPEEKMVGIAKSETEELETEIRAMPLVKFSQFINVLLLKKFRGMEPALGLSIHRISNEDHEELTKPQWLTYTSQELPDVERLIKGVVKAYKTILQSQNVSDDEILEHIDRLVERPQKKKRHWFFLQRK
jgi:hypothetical protein